MPIGPRDTPSDAEVAAHVAKPIPYVRRWVHPSELELGLKVKGSPITFSWRPYHERTPASRADYDKLKLSIERDGLRDPLIVHEGRVLIGMRRLEIARDLGIWKVEIAEVLEDVTRWWIHDIPRLKRLRAELGRHAYAEETHE